jgi:GTP-binding protein SAR1
MAARRLWKDYLTTVDGVVFIVDALDRERFPEAKRELDVSPSPPVHFPSSPLSACRLTRRPCVVVLARVHAQALLTQDDLANVPFLVLGNKIDVARAASEEELRYALGLQNTFGKEVRRPTRVLTSTTIA